MLDLLLAALGGNDGFINDQGDREVTQVVCPLVAKSENLHAFYELLLPDSAAADRLFYREFDGFEIVGVEVYGSFPWVFVTHELRIIVTGDNAVCQSIVFHKTL